MIWRTLPATLAVALAVAACAPAEQQSDATAEQQSDTAAEETTATTPIESAMSAAPASISADAQIVDWDMNELRAGTNGWTCLPDRPDTPGTDPWCITEAWGDFLNAYVNESRPPIFGKPSPPVSDPMWKRTANFRKI